MTSTLGVLQPYKLRLADIEMIQGSLAEQKVVISLTENRVTIELRAEEFRFLKEGASWDAAAGDVQIYELAEKALFGTGDSRPRIASATTTVAMHVQPLEMPREQILKPFMPRPFQDFPEGRIVLSFGNHFKWNEGEVLLDFPRNWLTASLSESRQ